MRLITSTAERSRKLFISKRGDVIMINGQNTILPSIVLQWMKRGRLELHELPREVVEAVRANVSFLRDLSGLSTEELGKLLFSDNNVGSQRTLTIRFFQHTTPEKAVILPKILGFNPSVIFVKNLRAIAIGYIKSIGDGSIKWENSVFAALPSCCKCGQAALTTNARFCHNCGEKYETGS